MKYLFSLMNFSSGFEYKNAKVLTYFNEALVHKTTCQDVTDFKADVSTFARKMGSNHEIIALSFMIILEVKRRDDVLNVVICQKNPRFH